MPRREIVRRLAAVMVLLDWLEAWPGATWHQRWLATGADQASAAWAEQVKVAGLLDGLDRPAQPAESPGGSCSWA